MAIAECASAGVTTFWRLLWNITEQKHGNKESISFKRKTDWIKFSYLKDHSKGVCILWHPASSYQIE